MTSVQQAWLISVVLHLMLASGFWLLRLTAIPVTAPVKTIDFEVVTALPEIEQTEPIIRKADERVRLRDRVEEKAQEDDMPSQAQTEEPVREVFGIARDALTDRQGVGPAVKLGTTLSKEEDDLELTADDINPLPVPQPRYLVSQLPRLLSEVDIPYPEQARAANIEGKVVLQLLIDQQGVVRKAQLISGPGYGLNEAAQQYITQFRFAPATIGDRPVAVEIQYVVTFSLRS